MIAYASLDRSTFCRFSLLQQYLVSMMASVSLLLNYDSCTLLTYQLGPEMQNLLIPLTSPAIINSKSVQNTLSYTEKVEITQELQTLITKALA